MKLFAERHRFPFPYLHDESQSVARAYDAVCTPDYFGYDKNLRLKYRGRLDEGRTTALRPARAGSWWRLCAPSRRTGLAPLDQTPSIGCSIKWKAGG